MAPIRVLVVDDEELARRNLTILLGRDPDIGSIDECDSGLEAIDLIERTAPDLVFLDVQMPGCDGFEVLERLGSDMPQAIVFVTAYDKYALRAFDTGALDYLLKPFDDMRFFRSLERAKEKLSRSLANPRQPIAKVAVKSRGQMLLIDVAEIDWIEAASYYACLHVRGTSHMVRRSLEKLEMDLDERKFVRIHRSTIVNLARVQGVDQGDDGEYEVALDSNVRLKLSRRLRKRLQDRLAEMSAGH